jgi:uncharacterized protein YbjT (DUF2867 family)
MRSLWPRRKKQKQRPEPRGTPQWHQTQERHYWGRQLTIGRRNNWITGGAAVLALLINVVGLLILRGTLETTKIAAIAARDQAAAALAANKIAPQTCCSW